MRRILFWLAIILIIIGVCSLNYSYYEDYKFQKEDKAEIDSFFEEFDESKENNDNKKSQTYEAVIEIPDINLKTGIIKTNNNYTTMNRNVSIYSSSDMPDKEFGNFILFAHSGNSRVSYFKNIHLLNKDNIITIYYHNKQYNYRVIQKYETLMNDSSVLKNDNNNKIITLITCKKNNSKKRIIVIGEIVKDL